MKVVTAKDAKYCFGRLIDLARAEPVAKHGPPVVVIAVAATSAAVRADRGLVTEARATEEAAASRATATKRRSASHLEPLERLHC